MGLIVDVIEHQRIAHVGIDHDLPHGVPPGVVDRLANAFVFRPEANDHLHSPGDTCVDGRLVGIPPRVESGRLVDRHAERIDLQEIGEGSQNDVGLGRDALVGVGVRRDPGHEKVSVDEVVPVVGPVHAVEARDACAAADHGSPASADWSCVRSPCPTRIRRGDILCDVRGSVGPAGAGRSSDAGCAARARRSCTGLGPASGNPAAGGGTPAAGIDAAASHRGPAHAARTSRAPDAGARPTRDA